MARLRLPLYGKILLWFGVNVIGLAALGFCFLQAQFKLSLDWMLSGKPGERIGAIGDKVTNEFSRSPESEWNARLRDLEQTHHVKFALFANDGSQAFGTPLQIPAELQSKLVDKRPPGEAPPPRRPGPIGKRPANAPPKPRFMLRAGDPGNYWAGIHLDLVRSADGLPLTLVMMSDSITGGGLFFELWPWIALLFAGLMLSALIWLPFVRGITSSIGVLNEAAGRIAHGKFDERIERHRSDELGELSTSVNAMAAQLGDYVAQQRRITADVAHELCSPIARMQMALGVIEQRSTPDQKTYLDKIDRELQHMAKLVEEVLSFSKAETLPDRVKPEDIDLSELVETVVQREASGHDVLVDVPPHLQIHTIREALDRAMGNVLRNAVRYAGQAGLIRLSASRDESGKVIIGISDEGPGVPAEALGRLFDAFYRPEVARTRGTGGSGLGLAIVKRCIEACGGNVRALNREPHGLEVVMEIPVSS